MFSLSPHKFHSLLILPVLLSWFLLGSTSVPDNHPPVAVSDSYTIHGSMIPLTPTLTVNDSDPDGDPLSISDIPQFPSHGTLARGVGNNFSYVANYGYIGADSFTYTVCDN